VDRASTPKGSSPFADCGGASKRRVGEGGSAEAWTAVKLKPTSALAEKRLPTFLNTTWSDGASDPAVDYAGAEVAFRAAEKLDP